MIRNVVMVTAAGSLLFGCMNAMADSSMEVQKTIQAAYSAENRAVEKKDVKQMFINYSADFTQTTKKGERLTLSSIKQVVPRMLMSAQKISDKTTVQKFSMKGNRAFATVSRHTDISIANPQTKKPMSATVDAVSVDTWVKSGKTWKIKLSQEKSEQQFVDGKPVN